MKRTSKLLAMLLAILMVLSLMVACGDTPAETTPESTTAAPETTKTPPETTKAPATTEAPATEAPTTEAPETEAPATEAPTTEAPVGEEPNVTEVPDVTEAPEESEEIGETEEIEETEETEEDEDPDDPIETEPVETEPVETEPVETEPAETEPEEEIGDLEALLPEKIELGLEMSILVEELYYAEWLDEDDGDIVGTELYSRVPRVSSRLGIELDVQRIAINHEGFVDETEKRHESSDPNLVVALASGYSQMVGRLAVDGRFHNIANSDNVNFDSPWWPKDLLINSTIDDKVYFVSGDISPTLIYETYAIFFNRELIERHNIEDPISLVLNYKWTIDKLIEVTSGIYEDLDKEKAGPSLGDFFAFNFNDDAHYKPLPFAMGIRVIEPDEEAGYVWSELYMGEKMENIATKVSDWIGSNEGVHAGTEGFYDYCEGFRQGNVIFNLGNFANASHYFQGYDIDYAVVPCPMYDEEQREYFSYYGNPTSFWGILNNHDLDSAAALLEYLAADAYVYISPALFERALKIKYITGEVDGLSRIFDIIRDGLVFDACMFYGQYLGSAYNGFAAIASPGAGSWSAGFGTFTLKGMKKSLNNIVDRLRALEY